MSWLPTFGSGAASESGPIPPFLKRQGRHLAALGITAGPEGLGLRQSREVSALGASLRLDAVETTPYLPHDLAPGAAPDAKDVRAWLEKSRDDMARKAGVSLQQAENAVKALAEAMQRPSYARWLGDAEAIRKEFWDFPAALPAPEAMARARRRHKELQAAVAMARGEALAGRARRFPPTRFANQSLSRPYQEVLPFLSTSLELELHIEEKLDAAAMERLLDETDESFPAAVDTLLAPARAVLLQKVKEQLRDVARRVKTLPHVELLSDQDIAATVAPYFGGLNRALKKRRAKSALVAVEEQAREAKYQGDVVKLNEKRASYADVASYYPTARGMARELILFVGPTNSGKTWRALNELAAGETGAYLAPLRLLALEGQEELEKRGKPTSFLTGEERDLRPEAQFVSSTIEMLDLERVVDAVVVDEVQLLADERRGWAWLAAVLGAPARKVIMTGSPDCVGLVKTLAETLGEPLTIHECQRHNELRVAPEPINLKDIRPGTAVVCFSRRDVLRLKTRIQEGTSFQVAVVYGNLSPQVRREEARRFRSGEAEILVATDAIAMGLNLPIAEVVFYTTEKFNGEEVTLLTPSEIRQIGGRAGRYGFAQFGVVNALNNRALGHIRDALHGESPPLEPPFYVAPGHNHVRIISEVLGTTSLERILTFFERAIEFSDERFTRSNIDDLSYLSTFVDERLPFLDVTERLTIASAPVGVRNETVVDWFLNRMLPQFPDPNYPHEGQDGLADLFEAAEAFTHEFAHDQLQLRDAEDYLKTLTVYAWLAYRYPHVFTRIEECEEKRESVNAFVERSLRENRGKRCLVCDAKLPADFAFRKCEACHAKAQEGGGRRRRGGGGRGRGSGRGSSADAGQGPGGADASAGRRKDGSRDGHRKRREGGRGEGQRRQRR